MTISVFTAAHRYVSGIGIWIGCSVIAAGLWALCKQRDDEDVYERRGGDGDPHARSNEGDRYGAQASTLARDGAAGRSTAGAKLAAKAAAIMNEAGSEPADAHTNTRRTARPPAAPGLLSERRHVS